MRKEEERELAALEYAGQPRLPEVVNEDTPLWIYAIAKVRMTNLNIGYAILRNFIADTPGIVKVFGDAAIADVVSVHPYLFLDKKYVPTLKDEDEARAYVAKAYSLDNVPKKWSKEMLTRLILADAAQRQLKDAREKN